jgi:hypothetical protein
MAASHLRFEALGSQHATDLPIKVTVQACTPQGDLVDSTRSMLAAGARRAQAHVSHCRLPR